MAAVSVKRSIDLPCKKVCIFIVMTTNMATGVLVIFRWLQTKTFLLIELERLNHKTYYTFDIVYIYFGVCVREGV